uniref:non-specific serine/threonine protein kinase n=1 Tax=viral metagenome TaxID=1070528 RepID=A0A6C0DIP1_9ZZZZ
MNNETKIIGNKYKIIKEIGAGTFGTIYEGINIRTNEKVAIKTELIEDEFKLLRYESTIYKLLADTSGIPKIKWFGKDDTNYYMVIDLLGNSLQLLIDMKGTLSLKTVLQIGVNILTILMNIHDKGFIHRDIKPENFLLSNNSPKKLYLIDFGLSKPYIINNKHIEITCKKKFIGTMNFASINCHFFYEQSRRDDLESLAYILMYFYLGHLEWMKSEEEEENISNMDDENDWIKNKKLDIINNENIPRIIMDFYKYTRSLEFNETPDYKFYIKTFIDKLEEMCRN